MTPEQIIDQVWKLRWYEVFQVAVTDDFVLLYKIWPVPVALIVSVLIIWWAISKESRPDD